MPATYTELLVESQPEAIETDEQYAAAMDRAGVLIRKGKSRTADETKLLRLLSVLIQDYDRRHALPADDAVSNKGITAVQLATIFDEECQDLNVTGFLFQRHVPP